MNRLLAALQPMSIVMIVLLAIFLIGLSVLPILVQKGRIKKALERARSLRAGDVVKLYEGRIGTVQKVLVSSEKDVQVVLDVSGAPMTVSHLYVAEVISRAPVGATQEQSGKEAADVLYERLQVGDTVRLSDGSTGTVTSIQRETPEGEKLTVDMGREDRSYTKDSLIEILTPEEAATAQSHTVREGKGLSNE